MILLTTITAKLQVILGAAVATDTHASFVDNITTPAGGVENHAQVAAGTFDLVGSPTSGQLPRNIQFFSITNKGAAAQTVTVTHTDGTTVVTLINAVPLAAGERMSWMYGHALTVYDATGAPKSQITGPGRFLRRTVISASGNWTPGLDAKNALIRMVGAGGAGGGSATAATSASAGGGGGSGSYLERYMPVTGGTAYVATIGAAGAGASGAVGGAGTNTTLVVGATTLTAPGGAGGTLMAAAATVVMGLGGSGGAVATNGDVNGTGSPGGFSYRGSAALAQSGVGGDSEFAGGANGIAAQGAGIAATGRGAGGGGAVTLNAGVAQAGGNGGAGLIVVDEYT
jgi:hypothetical protein